MIKFEVSGATAEEFTQKAVAAFGLMLIGLQQGLTELQRHQAMAQSMPPSADGPQPSAPSSTPTSTISSDKLDDLFTQTEPSVPPKADPPPSTRGTKGKPTKGPKLDDLKARLSDVITAATDRGWDIKRANAYALKLLGDFRVAKLSELKPEYFEEFLDVSTMYTTGNADE